MSWEYKIVLWSRMQPSYVLNEYEGSRYTQKELNELGSEGWELVTVYEGKAIFKRPKSEEAKVVE